MRKHSRPQAPAPLLEWIPPLARQAKGRRRPALLLMGVGIGIIAATATMDSMVHPAPRIIWNASASAPIGFWRILPDVPLRHGDMVLVHTPAKVRRLAAARHYIPVNVPLLKRIAARNGDEVCALKDMIYVNGESVATRLVQDRAGRALPRWEGCELLRNGRLLLLMDAPDSFDGRYFGPVSAEAVIGKATPLWLR